VARGLPSAAGPGEIDELVSLLLDLRAVEMGYERLEPGLAGLRAARSRSAAPRRCGRIAAHRRTGTARVKNPQVTELGTFR
jgi:hypothetical protein